MVESFSREKIKASTAEGRWRNHVWPSSCVTPAGTSTNLTSKIHAMTTRTHTNTPKVSIVDCERVLLVLKDY